MNVASDDQGAIIDYISKNLNVSTDSVAGAGKTTLILLLAKQFPNKQFIQVTYNSQLKHEVRHKAEKYSLKNIEIHTYHSLAVTFYNVLAHTDIWIRKIVEGDTPPVKALPKCNVFVIDEAQDMTFLYYKFVKKFLKDLNSNPQMLVVGDTFQGIYTFKGADTRFLSLADKIWGSEFKSTSMSTSYRITNEIAQFVNEKLVGNNRVKALKSGPKIQYIKHDIWQVHNVLVPMILEQIQCGVKPEEIFILAGSVKSPRSPIKLLENALVMHGIKCYVPLSDDKKIDDDTTIGKVIFTTFHQAKGRERRIVIVYGFDASYYDYYARDEPRERCPSTLYVAVTRALERLIVIEDERKESLPFLKGSITTNDYIEYTREPLRSKRRSGEPPDRILNPGDLIKFLREDILSQVTAQVEAMFETTPGTFTIEIPAKVKCGDIYEEISDVTTLGLFSLYEWKERGETPTILKSLTNELLDKGDHSFLIEAIDKVSKKCEEVNDFLYLANIYIAVKERLYFRLAQVTKYDWISEEIVAHCHAILRNCVGKNFIFEKSIVGDTPKNLFVWNSPEYGAIKIKGTFDIVGNTVWMLKCVDAITIDHQLLLIVWAWIWNKTNQSDKPFKIVNIKTGEIKTLIANGELIDSIVQTLLKNMFDKGSHKTDCEFLEWCK